MESCFRVVLPEIRKLNPLVLDIEPRRRYLLIAHLRVVVAL